MFYYNKQLFLELKFYVKTKYPPALSSKYVLQI